MGTTWGRFVCSSDIWLEDVSMPVVDCLGEEFLSYVQDGMSITVKEGGIVEVQ